MDAIEIGQATQELRDSELRVWLQFHAIRLPYRGNYSKLARKLPGGKCRVAIRDSVEGLRLKGYLEFEKGPDGRPVISLIKRLDVSQGAYSRF